MGYRVKRIGRMNGLRRVGRRPEQARNSPQLPPRACLPQRGILTKFLRKGEFSPRDSPHWRTFRPRNSSQNPAFPLENFQQFIEKPREFI